MPNVAVSTYSMMPIYKGFEGSTTLHPLQGDILLVKNVPAESLEIGDVIVFDTPSIPDPVVHRIIARWQNSSGHFFFKTNGDNKETNKYPDSWTVHEKDVIGKVVIRIPHIGWFLLTLQTNLGKILILSLAILVLFGEDIFGYLGLTKKEDNNSSTRTELQKNGNSEAKKPSRSYINIIKRKESIYIFLGTSIFLIFIFSNFLAGFSQTPSIDVFKINDSAESNSLLDSSPDSLMSLNPQGEWTEIIENFPQRVYFYPILIKLRSGGIFNNIHYFEIRVNQNQGLYRWTIVNNYIGTHTISGGIISQINGTVNISIHLYSRGLFASPIQTFTFPLFLQG